MSKPGSPTPIAPAAECEPTRPPGKRTRVRPRPKPKAPAPAPAPAPAKEEAAPPADVPIGPRVVFVPPMIKGRIPAYIALLDVDTTGVTSAVLGSDSWPRAFRENPGAEAFRVIRKHLAQGYVLAHANLDAISVGFNFSRGDKSANGMLEVMCLIDDLRAPALPSARAAESTTAHGGSGSHERGSEETGSEDESGGGVDLKVVKAEGAGKESRAVTNEAGDSTSDGYSVTRSREAQTMVWCSGRVRFAWTVTISEIEDTAHDVAPIAGVVVGNDGEPARSFGGEAFGEARFELPASECKIA